MDALDALARRHGLQVIEDCAHAHRDGIADGRKAGTFGDFGCFSFYATKNVTTGEGGMVLARDAEDDRRASRCSRCTGMTQGRLEALQR